MSPECVQSTSGMPAALTAAFYAALKFEIWRCQNWIEAACKRPHAQTAAEDFLDTTSFVVMVRKSCKVGSSAIHQPFWITVHSRQLKDGLAEPCLDER